MMQLALAKVAFLLAAAGPVTSTPLGSSAASAFSDLIGYEEPTVSPGEPVVHPEYITVPKDYVLDEEALANITSRSQLPIETRDVLGGSDDRFQWDGLEYPFKTIGKVIWSTGGYCSGTLIGPRHVLTARHCTGLNADTGTIRFAPSYLNGDRLGSATVTGVISDPDYGQYPEYSQCWLKNDYAILILDQRLGDKHGYMFLASNPDPAWANRGKLNTCGYPGDKGKQTKWCQYERNLRTVGGCGDNTGPITSDIDVAPGQSGSAVWHLAEDKTMWIWGVLSSASASDTILASGSTMLLGWQFAMKAYP